MANFKLLFARDLFPPIPKKPQLGKRQGASNVQSALGRLAKPEASGL